MQTSGNKIAAMLAMAAVVFESPFKHMPAMDYPTVKRATNRSGKRNPVGSKLARKAAEGRLTGNHRGEYCQGIMRQLARTRGKASPV